MQYRQRVTRRLLENGSAGLETTTEYRERALCCAIQIAVFIAHAEFGAQAIIKSGEMIEDGQVAGAIEHEQGSRLMVPTRSRRAVQIAIVIEDQAHRRAGTVARRALKHVKR